MAAPAAGTLLNNRYRLQRLLGEGGMGTVWLAHDESADNSEVALKLLGATVSEVERRRFEREIRTLRELDHPHIVPFRDLGWSDDRFFYAMDYISDVSLETVLEKFPDGLAEEHLDRFLALSLEILSALAYLHDLRLVHRDVKPSNILISSTHPPDLTDSDRWLTSDRISAHLADFGLVKASEAEGALTRSVLGTPRYLAPEQIESPAAVDERSDLFSFGVLLYRAISGRLPFARLGDVLSADGPRALHELRPEIPEALSEIVAGLLRREPHRRPSDAREVMAMIEALRESTPAEPLAVRVARRPQPAFTGRAVEVGTLLASARKAARGDGRWVAIRGERGIGKTWLVSRSELRTRALVEERLAYFSGTFSEKGPHNGFTELIERVLSHLDRRYGHQTVTLALGRWGRHLADTFPRLAGSPHLEDCPPLESDLPAEIIKERVIDSVVGVLTAELEVEPRILVLEDLHACDEFDLELLRRLILGALPLPLLVVTTHRPDTALRITALGRLLREIAVEERLEEIELSPFDEKETQAMVRSLLVPDREVEEAAVSALWKRSDGVPLYLSQLVSSMWARGLFRFSEECWLVDEKTLSELTIPESTRSHFLLLLDEVPTAQRRCLNLAAVIGPSIDFETLLSATGIDEFELDEQCRLLVRSGLLQEEAAGFRWVHGFERDIVLSELTSPMRRRLHARIGRILEEQHDDDLEPYIEAIAEHFTLGGDDAKALGYLVRAADRAEQSYALRRALELIEGALKISRDPTIERELIVRQGDLRMRLGETEQALNVFRQAIGHYTAIEELLLGDEIPADRHDELGAYGQLLQRFGEVQIHGGEYSLALDNFRKAQGIAERVGNNTAVAMALCRQGAANAFDDRLEEAQAAYQSVAEESSDGDGMATARVIALVGLSSISRRLGRLDDALRYCQEALPAAEIVGNPTQIASLWGQFGTLYQNLGRQREAIDAYERSRGLREELGDRRGLAITLMNLGRLHSSAGDFRRGGESLEEALELFQATGDLQGRVLTLGNLGTLHFHRGEFLDARRLLDEYLHLARSHRLRRPEADALHCLGNLELELHHIEDARHLLELSEKGFEEAGDRQGVLSTRVSLSRVLGREENAAAALEEAAATGEEADSLGAQPILSEALRVQAEALRELGNLEGAQEKAQQALRACEEHRLPYSVGVCHRTLAKIYRDRGFEWADRAGASFDRSLAVLEGLGARHAHAVSRREFASFLLLVDETTLAREALEGVETVFSELSSEVELARTRALMEKTSDGT